MVTKMLSIEEAKLVYSFLVGFLGSAAYITALNFKFIGESDRHRKFVIGPFLQQYSNQISKSKCFWYCIIGGSVAVVFQYDVPNFVAVQSLILGATWPAVVSQFLSGRMTGPSAAEISDLVSSGLRPEEVTKMREDTRVRFQGIKVLEKKKK